MDRCCHLPDLGSDGAAALLKVPVPYIESRSPDYLLKGRIQDPSDGAAELRKLRLRAKASPELWGAVPPAVYLKCLVGTSIPDTQYHLPCSEENVLLRFCLAHREDAAVVQRVY